MESNNFSIKTDEFINNQTKECPYCNAIIPLSEYNDHIFCHQLDGQENGDQGFNINNYGLKLNNNNSLSNDSSSNNNIYNNSNNLINNNICNNNNQRNIQGQPYINPIYQGLNTINVINDNNTNQNNQNNQNIENNINNGNNNNKQESFINRIKNFFIPSNNNNNNNQNSRDIMNIPRENLSPEELEERNKIEEQRAYEKKILGIASSKSEAKIEDNRSTREKISDFFQNNQSAIFATIDIIGCLTLHTPSIGRTILRVSNLIGDQYNNFVNNKNNENNNIGTNEYDNIIREHPELRKKDKDPDTIIKFLPVSEVKEIRNQENSNNNNNKCVICLSEFELGDQVSALPCAHVFHTECIASWIKKHCQCPVCKFNVTLKTLIGGV